jgi:hypothetical protein
LGGHGLGNILTAAILQYGDLITPDYDGSDQDHIP